jgi:rubrerythrin
VFAPPGLNPPSARSRLGHAADETRAEGFEELAKWFDSLAKVEKSHAELYRKALESLI